LDGSGDPYKATINDYLGKWVFSGDFTASQYSHGKFIGGGNSLNNLKKIYPNKDFTENYIKGTEKAVRWIGKHFVWYLKNFREILPDCVVNDQWTI
jgi:hypothetical protein